MRTFRPATTMQMTRLCLAVGTVSGMAALGLGGHTVWADSCTTPSNGPTGPAAGTFVYQCDGTYAGDWINQYYVYNPNGGEQTPLYGPDYTYDCATNTWTQTEWDYDAASGAYIENRVAAAAPPNLPTNCPVPSTSSSSPTPAPTATTQTTATTPDPSPQSTSNSDNATSSSAPTVNNTVSSQAKSGNATVANNGSAGNATSGTANAELNVENLVQSVSNALGSNVATFTSNVDGNVNGDIVLNPSTILADATTDPQSNQGTTESNSTSNATLDNHITASAATGNAAVADNGTAGSATTGDAAAIVNLINMIDTAVASGQSFIGTININGDLNGNILIPQSVIDELLGSNASSNNPNDTTANTAANETITNNITSNATSGNAVVANNQTAGNATSGNAGTNVTVLNLTGTDIIGQNVLLVFVNVLGQWVGMIVNAPTGATTAEFGGGITSDTPSANNGVVEADAQLGITNNVNVSAKSGNAYVIDNGLAGNATSGNADTLVNILNLENSDLSLANWFGILFINVFGTWNGNFGILPAPTTPSNGPANGASQSASLQSPHGAFHRFATFLPTSYNDPMAGSSNDSTTTSNNGPTAVLGDATIYPPASRLLSNDSTKVTNSSHYAYALPALGIIVAVALLGLAERDRFMGHKK